MRCFFPIGFGAVSCAMCVEPAGLRSAGRSKEFVGGRGRGGPTQQLAACTTVSARRRCVPWTAKEACQNTIVSMRRGTSCPEGHARGWRRGPRGLREGPSLLRNDWLGVEGERGAGGEHYCLLAMPGELGRSARQAQKRVTASSWAACRVGSASKRQSSPARGRGYLLHPRARGTLRGTWRAGFGTCPLVLRVCFRFAGRCSWVL